MKTKLRITDDPKEMIAIGKEIFKEKANIYNERMLNILNKSIDKNMPDATEQEKTDMLYRSVYDYWVYGNNIDEEFYFHFYRKTHEEKSTYITQKNRLLYIYHLNKKEDGYLLNDKYEAYLQLKDYYMRDVIQISSDADFETFCDFVEKHPTYVVKPVDLALAVGVYKATTLPTDDKRAAFDALLAEAKVNKSNYQWSDRDNSNPAAMVLEEIIEQDEGLAKIHPESVNGIRCTTIRVGDKVHLLHPWFKIGANGEFVTSAAAGTFDAGIDAKTGIVDTNAFGEAQEEYEFHPDTGVRVPGYQIPKWDELLALLDKIGRHFPTINYVGWDMVLTPKGWCIMEGNFAGEAMWQMVYGKGMKAELEELIGWRPEPNKFWWE